MFHEQNSSELRANIHIDERNTSFKLSDGLLPNGRHFENHRAMMIAELLLDTLSSFSPESHTILLSNTKLSMANHRVQR